MKSGREGDRNTAVIYKIDPLVPRGLVRRCRDTENSRVLILATDHSSVYTRVTFRHLAHLSNDGGAW